MGEYRLGEKTIYVPETTELTGNYPNPFNPSTTLTFDVGFEDGPDQLIRCDIYNIRGQLIRTLIHNRLAIGRYEWRWNGQTDTGKQVASGVYITRFVSSAGYTKTLKMTLIR
jgi:flagellar hook assembly protein FlgD